MPESQPVRRWAVVRCQECGREDDSEERGWKAYLGDADGGGDEVLVFCPQCAAREFGDDVLSIALSAIDVHSTRRA